MFHTKIREKKKWIWIRDKNKCNKRHRLATNWDRLEKKLWAHLWSLIGAYFAWNSHGIGGGGSGGGSDGDTDRPSMQSIDAVRRGPLSTWLNCRSAYAASDHTHNLFLFSHSAERKWCECAMHFTLSVQTFYSYARAVQLYFLFIYFFCRLFFGIPTELHSQLFGCCLEWEKKETIEANDLLTNIFFSFFSCVDQLADSEMWYCRAHTPVACIHFFSRIAHRIASKCGRTVVCYSQCETVRLGC